MVGWPYEIENKGKKNRETHYHEERYYGHGLKEINELRKAMENKIKKNISEKTVRVMGL